MKQGFGILILIAFTFPANAQIDYIQYKEHYNISCRIPDSAVIVQNQTLMDSLHSLKIINGEKEFLYDHGWLYYMRYLKWKNLNDLRIAAKSFEEGWEQHKDLSALWSLGHIYRPLGECQKSLDLTELYLEEIHDSIPVDYQQVYYRYKFCRNKE